MNDRYDVAIERFEEPVSTDYGSLAQRRRRVFAMYGGYAIVCAGFWFADQTQKGSALRFGSLAIVLAGFLTFACGFYLLMRRTFINAPHVRDQALDERQRMLRDRAMSASYMLLSVLLTLQALVFVIGATWKNSVALVVPAGFANAYFWGAFLLAMTLPTALLAWTTPDPLPEDD